ncbi:MAG: hypothetical protein HY821_24575 [Acidobacteria bacterium]|nr:hypothetical protein [Acidobacteriota bacterium]
MSRQLRSWIPIAAPARREAADGSEAPLRVVLGFEPTWFHRRCGVDFGRRWHEDAEYRRATLVEMRADLRKSFPETDQWSGAEARDVNTIAGCYGVGWMPAVFGLPLRYYEDRWPHPEPGHELSEEAAERLETGALLGSAFVEGLLTQVDRMAAMWGPVYGDLNWQGVLNTAFQVRGQQIFLDMVERPELAEHLFEVIAETLIRLARMVQERQRRSGAEIDWMCVSNCTLSMISPAMYRRVLRRYDERIAGSFGRFGVHTCNWNATPYLGGLSELPGVGYIDMGFDTDLVKAKELFPEARRAVLFTVGKLADAAEVERFLSRVWNELAPCDVVVADIPWDMPDEAVRGMLRAAAKTME